MNDIIITSTTNEKNQKIKEIRTNSPFAKVKFFSYKEFMHIFPYTYDNKALEYIMKECNVSLEIAKIYLENLIYNIEDVINEKCTFLKKIKESLLENKLLKRNNLLETYLSHSSIYLYNIQETKSLKKLISQFSPKYITPEKKTFIPKVYLLENIEQEIAFIGEQIIALLKNGVSLDNIYLSNIPSEYKIPLKRIFKMMHIPFSLEKTTTINQTTMGRMFISQIDDLKEALNKIQNLVKTEAAENLYNQILSIVNTYYLNEFQKEFILYDLKHTIVKEKHTGNCVQEINIKNQHFTDKDHVFLMSFTKDIIPKIKKDEDYLDDKTKEALGLDTSIDLNKIEEQNLLSIIQSIKNCIITLKKTNSGKDCIPSDLLDLMNIEIKKGSLHYNVSHEYNKYILGILLDKYVKYGTITDTLLSLNQTYKIPYRNYNNAFTNIPKEKIWKKENQELKISYTTIDTYNKCAFSYYIKNILKLDFYEESFQIKIGNIFHKILEEQDYETFDFDICFDQIINTLEFSKKEKILLRKLKEEFRFTIITLEKRKKFSSLTNNLREHSVEIPLPNSIKTTMKGRIDNILFERIEGELYYTIIDYKTGGIILEEEKMPLGFSLQLPTYLYLLEHEEYFKKGKLGGFYLQPLLVNNLSKKEGEDFTVTKEKALKMKGFSSSDKEVLKYVDNSFIDSNCIQSLKVKNDGEFYNYSKILTKKDEEILKEVVIKNIEKGVKNITEGNFQINPKIINNEENIACEYCPFKDLCFHEPKDNIYLESDKKFLKKEETDGLDERTGNSNLYEWN